MVRIKVQLEAINCERPHTRVLTSMCARILQCVRRTVYTVQRALYILPCTYTVRRTSHAIEDSTRLCGVRNVLFTTVQCTVYILYSVQCIVSSVQCTVYSVYAIQYEAMYTIVYVEPYHTLSYMYDSTIIIL